MERQRYCKNNNNQIAKRAYDRNDIFMDVNVYTHNKQKTSNLEAIHGGGAR